LTQTQVSLFLLPGFLTLLKDFKPILEHAPIGEDLFSASSEDRFQAGDQFFSWYQRFEAKVRKTSRPRVLIGYSFGARLSIQIMNQNDSLWDQVILLSPRLTILDSNRFERLASDLKWAKAFENDPWEETVQRWNQQAVFLNTKSHLKLKSEFSIPSLQTALQNFSLGNQVIKEIPTHIPVLLLIGEYEATSYQNPFPIKPILIPKAGHRTYLDAPYAVKEEILKFLS
jgi:pimeloyl-ACP methyl ester carboxylesterase